MKGVWHLEFTNNILTREVIFGKDRFAGVGRVWMSFMKKLETRRFEMKRTEFLILSGVILSNIMMSAPDFKASRT